MHTPELLLADLNRSLRQARSAAQVLDDDGLDAELLPVMRRLLLAEVLGESRILAIAGSQGAGKTTLLNAMYGFEGADACWLAPNEGRGEKLPVLIVEDPDIQAPVGCVRRLTDDGSRVTEVDVDVRQFRDATSGADAKALLPVLRTPRRYFDSPAQAWLLLPGYEPVTRDNSEWQALMRQAVVGATGCVIVTDETRLATEEQLAIARDMVEHDLPGVQPLVVITKTEGLVSDAAGQRRLIEQAAHAFGLPPDTARILCTGVSSDSYVERWLPELRAALSDIASPNGGARRNQIARLEEVIDKDLGRALRRVKDRANVFYQARVVGVGSENEVRSILDSFDEACDDLREQHSSAVGQMLDDHAQLAWSAMQDTLRDDYEKLLPRIRGVFEGTTEAHQRLENDIKRAWNRPGPVLPEYASRVGPLTRRVLDGTTRSDATQARLEAGVLVRLGYVEMDGSAVSWQQSALHQRNLQVIFQAGDGDPARTNMHLENSIKLLPALAIEYARAATLVPEIVGVDPRTLTPMPRANLGTRAAEFQAECSKAKDLSKTVLGTIAAILAVDVAVDGDIDVVPALLGHAVATGTGAGATGTAVAGGIGAAGVAAGSSIVPFVAGAVAIGYLVNHAMQQCREHDERARAYAQQLIYLIADAHKAHFLAHFNQVTGAVRERLRSALRRRYRLDEALMEHDRLAKALADLKAARRDLLDEISTSGQSVEIFRTTAA